MSWYIDEDVIDDGDAVGQWNGEEDTYEECILNCTNKFKMYRTLGCFDIY